MPEEGGTFVLVGSNFGRPDHPAWTANLLRNPEAEVSWKGRDIPVRAVLLAGEDREAAWAALLRFWPPYGAYAARVEREIRLFRLTPR
jgi:deazaflavin-dependent oxidoreductase (nitroreductase family)